MKGKGERVLVTVGVGPGVAVSVGVGVFVGVAVFGGKVAAEVDVIVGRGVFMTTRVGASSGGSGVLVAGIFIATVGSAVGTAVSVG